MTKYLLLNPLTPESFGLSTFDEIVEALEEFGCGMILSLTTEGRVVGFAITKSKEALENLCTTVSLDGVMVEYSATYDQVVRMV